MQREVDMVHYKKSVFRSLAMVTQLGFSVLTPVLLCVYTGYLVDSHFGTKLMVPMLILGAVFFMKTAKEAGNDGVAE